MASEDTTVQTEISDKVRVPGALDPPCRASPVASNSFHPALR